jgi:hypothetical protein
VHALHLWMSELDYAIELEVECLDNDPNNVAFVRATFTIRGRDDVKEYVACKMYSMAAGFDFDSVTLGTTLVSKVETLLLLFVVENITTKHANHVLAEIEMEAERVLESFRPKEYDALRTGNILSGGCLN